MRNEKENISAIYTVAAYDWLIGIAVVGLVFSVTNSKKSITDVYFNKSKYS